MKYLKLYEDLNDGPKLGDYVICTYEKYNSEPLNKFLSENIGQVVDFDIDKRISGKMDLYSMRKSYPEFIEYPIKYDTDSNIKEFFNSSNFRYFEKESVLFYSSDKEECEVYLSAKKYNI